MGLKDQLVTEKNEYDVSITSENLVDDACWICIWWNLPHLEQDALQPVFEESLQNQGSLDILELNRLRRALMIGSHAWDHQLYLLNSQLKKEASVGNGSSLLGVWRCMNLQRLTKEYRKVQMKGKEKLTLMEKLMVNGDNKDPYKLLSPGSSLSGIKSFTQMTSNMMHQRQCVIDVEI